MDPVRFSFRFSFSYCAVIEVFIINTHTTEKEMLRPQLNWTSFHLDIPKSMFTFVQQNIYSFAQQ